MPPTLGPLRSLWYRWKMMRLPWRKKWLVGLDLQGNTYWEFKDALHSRRTRRIVKYSQWTHHGDVNVPPQWMQWLRHTRYEVPTLAEQRDDIRRQERIKVLAAEADARWASKASALDAPDKQQPVQMLESRDTRTGIRQMSATQEARDIAEPLQHVDNASGAVKENPDVRHQPEDTPPPSTKSRPRTEPSESPWKQSMRTNPGDEWQPESWAPSPARRRA